MITRQRRQSRLSRLWMPLLTAAFLGYFAFHAFNGSFGKWAMDRMESQAVQLGSALDQLKQEHADLARRVAFLKPESLDADMVDLQARAQLNVVRPDEVVVSFGATQQSAQ
jgi:cell division protein FtsB